MHPPASPHQPSPTKTDWRYCFSHLDEACSQAFAKDLAAILRPGDVLALDGDVGMGKSTLARALLRALAEDEYLEVPSPTFTLVQSYELNDLDVSHFDLYRISDFEELFEIGFEESWQNGCALVEWPDRGEELLPASTLWLHFEDAQAVQGSARQLTLQGTGVWRERLERLCQKRQLLIECGWGRAELTAIAGDLSTRSYQRAFLGERHAILMDMPARTPGPVMADGRLYDLVAHRVTELAPMVTIGENLAQAGLLVPCCFGHNLSAGLGLWEDFGTRTLARPQINPELQPNDKQGTTVSSEPIEPISERYEAAISALASFHHTGWPSDLSQLKGVGGAFTLNRYDQDAFEIELSIFLDWYWPFVKGADCPIAVREAFYQLWKPGLDFLQASEQSLVLRDVQDPNCFWLEDARNQRAVGFIDFQDCLLGPVAYDIASLCMDARVSIDADLERHLKAAYMQHRSFDQSTQSIFEQSYALCGVQRTSKNLGAFARAKLDLGRHSYLAHIPRGLDYLARCLNHPDLADLWAFYNENKLLDMPTEL